MTSKFRTSSTTQAGFVRIGVIQWVAFAILLASVFSASKRAAVPAVMGIVKFLWPLLVLWLVWRLIKAKISATVQRFQRQVMDAAGQGGVSGPGAHRFRATSPAAGGGEVLDLCGKCGTLLSPGHRCAKA